MCWLSDKMCIFADFFTHVLKYIYIENTRYGQEVFTKYPTFTIPFAMCDFNDGDDEIVGCGGTN